MSERDGVDALGHADVRVGEVDVHEVVGRGNVHLIFNNGKKRIRGCERTKRTLWLQNIAWMIRGALSV